MRKLKLDLDRLSVESFATDFSARRGGTVRGAEYDTMDWGIGPEQAADTLAVAPQAPSSSDPSNYTCASGGPVCCA